jgi:hypothetical protein
MEYLKTYEGFFNFNKKDDNKLNSLINKIYKNENTEIYGISGGHIFFTEVGNKELKIEHDIKKDDYNVYYDDEKLETSSGTSKKLYRLLRHRGKILK